MSVLTEIRNLGRRPSLKIVGAAVAVGVALIPSIYAFERVSLSASQGRVSTRTAPPQPFVQPPQPFVQVEAPGLIRPPISGVEGSGMRDDDEVIGIEVGGRARCYRLGALDNRTNHVVNDLIGGIPVSVTYCDITNCVRVYTDPNGTTPLGFGVGGLFTGDGPEMVVKLDGDFYLQKSGKRIKPGPGPAGIPYDLIEPTRTTWKEWVRRHPQTDVYAGDRAKDSK